MIQPPAGKFLFRAAICLLAAEFCGIFLGPLAAADASWLVGAPLHETLSQKVGITWNNIPLRQALTNFSKSRRLAMVLDRRIDPDQKIEFATENVPLLELLERIAARVQSGVTIVGPVAYFGPKSTAERLRTIVAMRKEDVAAMPVASRTAWVQLKPLKWDDLTTPRDLLAALAAEGKVRLEGNQRVPHDLWAAVDLPPLSLAERLSLILAQFDLTYEIAAEGQSIRLVDMPEKPLIEHSYSVSGAAPETATKLRQLSLLADARISVVGNKLVVRARQEDQEVIDDLLSGRSARRTTVNPGRKVYTLRAEESVEKLLSALGPQMELDIRIDRAAIAAAKLSLDKKIKLDVKDASAEELLHALLDPAGLKAVRQGETVEVKPK